MSSSVKFSGLTLLNPKYSKEVMDLCHAKLKASAKNDGTEVIMVGLNFEHDIWTIRSGEILQPTEGKPAYVTVDGKPAHITFSVKTKLDELLALKAQEVSQREGVPLEKMYAYRENIKFSKKEARQLLASVAEPKPKQTFGQWLKAPFTPQPYVRDLPINLDWAEIWNAKPLS